ATSAEWWRSCAVATDLRQIVLAGADERDLTKLAEYEAIGGYRALQKARAMTPQAIIDELIASELRGRGGGSPPGARAASAVPQARAHLRGDVTIVLPRGAGAYICGEETALLESLEGNRGQPRTRPPYPAVEGLAASPTVVNNVETMATVPPIIAMGGP